MMFLMYDIFRDRLNECAEKKEQEHNDKACRIFIKIFCSRFTGTPTDFAGGPYFSILSNINLPPSCCSAADSSIPLSPSRFPKYSFPSKPPPAEEEEEAAAALVSPLSAAGDE